MIAIFGFRKLSLVFEKLRGQPYAYLNICLLLCNHQKQKQAGFYESGNGSSK